MFSPIVLFLNFNLCSSLLVVQVLNVYSPGNYFYIEASSPRKPGDKSTITSPTIPITGSRCELEFWYHMGGSGIGMLLVNLDFGYYSENLMTLTGDQGDV